jgi:hypothetical protein
MDMEHFDQIPCMSHKIMGGHTRGKLFVHEELLSDGAQSGQSQALLHICVLSLMPQIDLKMHRKAASAIEKVFFTPLWTNSSSSTHVTRHAEGILQHQYLLATETGRYRFARTDETTWLVCGKILQAVKSEHDSIIVSNPIPNFLRTRTVQLIGNYLLCSCGFFKRSGLPCCHLFYILRRGPIPADCATRWRHDYIGRWFTGSKEYDMAFKIAQKQETICSFYEPTNGECPTSYTVFSLGSMEDIHFYEKPMECTLYTIEGSSILCQSFRNEKVLPSSKLPWECSSHN